MKYYLTQLTISRLRKNSNPSISFMVNFDPSRDEMMTKGTPEQLNNVTQVFLKMKKFNIAELQNAFSEK